MSKLVENRIRQRLHKNETLVKVGIIKKLTGWTKYDLREARKNKLIRQVAIPKDENKKEIFYILESLNPLFIKRSA